MQTKEELFGEGSSFSFDKFGRDFLSEYLQNGYGVLPKAELDLLVLKLLLENGAGFSATESTSSKGIPHISINHKRLYKLSSILQVSPGRVRNGLDKLAFRSPPDEQSLRQWLREELKSSELAQDADGRVNIQIDDARLREFAISQIRETYGLVDWSFNTSVLRLTPEKFLAIAFASLSPEERAEAERKIEELLNPDSQSTESKTESKGLLRQFVEQFVVSAGKHSGKTASRLIWAFLTGGLTEAGEVVDTASKLIDKLGALKSQKS